MYPSSRLSRFSGVGVATCLGIATLLALPQAARADVVFTTIPVTNTFDNSGSYGVSGDDIGYGAVAMPFTPSSSFTLTSVEVAGRHFFGGTNSYTFQVVNDAAGAPGSTVIASGTITSFTGVASIQSFAASGAVNAGTNYWLTASPGANDAFGGWYLSSPAVTGTRASQSSSGGAWTIDPGQFQTAFRINGTLLGGSAPEPGTLALLALGMVGGVVVVRRRK